MGEMFQSATRVHLRADKGHRSPNDWPIMCRHVIQRSQPIRSVCAAGIYLNCCNQQAIQRSSGVFSRSKGREGQSWWTSHELKTSQQRSNGFTVFSGRSSKSFDENKESERLPQTIGEDQKSRQLPSIRVNFNFSSHLGLRVNQNNFAPFSAPMIRTALRNPSFSTAKVPKWKRKSRAGKSLYSQMPKKWVYKFILKIMFSYLIIQHLGRLRTK